MRTQSQTVIYSSSTISSHPRASAVLKRAYKQQVSIKRGYFHRRKDSFHKVRVKNHWHFCQSYRRFKFLLTSSLMTSSKISRLLKTKERWFQSGNRGGRRDSLIFLFLTLRKACFPRQSTLSRWLVVQPTSTTNRWVCFMTKIKQFLIKASYKWFNSNTLT